MTKTDVAKMTAKFIVGASASFVASNVIRNNTTPSTPVQEAEVVVGSLVVGAMVGEAAEDWTDKKIDAIIDWYHTNVKK